MHSLDNLWIAGRFVVHGSFAHIVPCDEEGCFCLVFSENVKYGGGVNVRSVICSRNLAPVT